MFVVKSTLLSTCSNPDPFDPAYFATFIAKYTHHFFSHTHGTLAAKVYEDARKRIVSTKIQSNFRRYTLRSSYIRLGHAVVLIQAGLRAMAARYELRYRRLHKAATTLQAIWRGHRDYTSYKKLTKATIVTQCGWRGKVARRELQRLKMKLYFPIHQCFEGRTGNRNIKRSGS
ncbi:putative IQ motif, EF-hand binding, P-loop containing nucleoside triphosphate hydrolase [Helianthus anomalus]